MTHLIPCLAMPCSSPVGQTASPVEVPLAGPPSASVSSARERRAFDRSLTELGTCLSVRVFPFRSSCLSGKPPHHQGQTWRMCHAAFRKGDACCNMAQWYIPYDTAYSRPWLLLLWRGHMGEEDCTNRDHNSPSACHSLTARLWSS